MRGSETLVLPREAWPHLKRGDYGQVLATTYPTVIKVESDPVGATDEDWQVVALYAIATAYAGDPSRAVDIATVAYGRLLELQGPYSEATMSAQRALAVAQLSAGDQHAALSNAEQVHALYAGAHGEYAAVTLDAAADLATCLHRTTRCADGTGLMQSTVDAYVREHGPDPTSIGMLARLGAMLRDCGQFDHAHHLLGQARRLAQSVLPPGDELIIAITKLARAGADPAHTCTAGPHPDGAEPVEDWLAAIRDREPTYDPPIEPAERPTAAPPPAAAPTAAAPPAEDRLPDPPSDLAARPPAAPIASPESAPPIAPPVSAPPVASPPVSAPPVASPARVPPSAAARVPPPASAAAPVRPARPTAPAARPPVAPARAVEASDRQGVMGLLSLLARPAHGDREQRDALRRPLGGPRQITVVNPKGGAGKTVATLMLGLSFGQARGGYVLAWDNNETQGTLGMRAQLGDNNRNVRHLLRDLARFTHGNGGIAELSTYLRPQTAMFDVLASDESATAGEMLTASAFRELRSVVTQFYKLIIVDTGNNVRAANWRAAIDATDQIVITVPARNDSAETAARMLDHLDRTDRGELVRRAVVVVTEAPQRVGVDHVGVDLRFIEQHFRSRCRAVLRVPYDRHLDSGAPIDYAAIAAATRRSWRRVAVAVATGL